VSARELPPRLVDIRRYVLERIGDAVDVT